MRKRKAQQSEVHRDFSFIARVIHQELIEKFLIIQGVHRAHIKVTLTSMATHWAISLLVYFRQLMATANIENAFKKDPKKKNLMRI